MHCRAGKSEAVEGMQSLVDVGDNAAGAKTGGQQGEPVKKTLCAAATEGTHRHGTRRLYVSQSFLYLQGADTRVSPQGATVRVRNPSITANQSVDDQDSLLRAGFVVPRLPMGEQDAEVDGVEVRQRRGEAAGQAPRPGHDPVAQAVGPREGQCPV